MATTKLPPGVTQAMIDASLAANPYASTGGYMGAAPISLPGVDTPAPPPDYTSNLLGDSILGQQTSDLSAQGIADAAGSKAKIDRAVINFGEVPDFANVVKQLGLDPNSPLAKLLFGTVDASTINAANELTNAGLSTTAQLERTHSMNLGDIMDKLAARGVVRSGATTRGVDLENTGYLGSQFKSRNDLLDYLSGVQSAFAQSEGDRQRSLAGYLNDAAARQAQLHPYVAPPEPVNQNPGGGTTPPAGSSAGGAGGAAGGATGGAGGSGGGGGGGGGGAPDTSAAALLARSQGLNAQYGLGGAPDTSASALAARSEGMNALYGLGGYSPVTAATVPAAYGNPVVEDAPRGLPTGQASTAPPSMPAPPPIAVPAMAPSGTMQSTSFGGSNGPYVAPPPAAPTTSTTPTSWTNSVLKRLNLPDY